MQLFACGLCQLQVPLPSLLPAELPVYMPQSDTLKLNTRKICKACHVLLLQIHEMSSQPQLKYCDPQFKNPTVDNLKSIVPQARHSLQVVYSSTSAINAGQRGRANSDNKNKIITKRFSQENVNNEHEAEDPIHPYIMLVIQELKSKNMLCLSYLPKTLQLLVYFSTQHLAKNAYVSPQQRRQKLKNVILFLS